MNISNLISNYIIAGKYNINCATTSLKNARRYAENQFNKADKNLDEELPDFDENYLNLQTACNKALDVPRIEMPVIEPDDIDQFNKDIKTGRVDIFAPYSKGKLYTPTGLERDRKEGKNWIKLGYKDGSIDDDKIKAKLVRIPAKKLIPTQSQIWLEKIVNNIIEFGIPTSNSPVTNVTIIVSKEGYILDGHHRYGQAMIRNPDLKMRCLKVPISIKLLLKIGRSYGNAIGREQKG